MTDNLSAVLYKKMDLRMENRPIPEPGKNEVLIRMASVGICGSDVHYWTTGQCGPFIVVDPMVLGHESAGVVAKCGEEVTHLKPGDRVAIEPGVPCRYCEHCKTGAYNLCPDVIFCATPPVHGNLCRYYTHAADFCFKLPPHVTLEEGALFEPFAVAIHACRRAHVSAGHKLLVCGAGPIGLMCMLAARAMGATNILVTDIAQNRVEKAQSLGADHVLNVKSAGTPEQLAKKVHDILGCQPDIIMECTGAEPSIQLGIHAVKNGGTVLLVGLGPVDVTAPLLAASCREVDIRGVFRYANCYPIALDLVASGKVDIKPLITHRFSLEDTKEAYETSRTGAGGAIKVLIKCSDQN